MTNVKIELDEQTLKTLVINHLSSLLNVELTEKDIHIQLKSARYAHKDEWEAARFRAVIDTTRP